MSVRINLGNWGSIFAVPSSVVDKHLKIASPLQLKVLLYLLKNSDTTYTYEELAEFFNVHIDDIKDCVAFWIEREVIAEFDNILMPSNNKVEETQKPVEIQSVESENKTKFVKPRLTKPDIITAAQRVSADSNLQHLFDELQMVLSKPLSSGDTQTVVMLYDTCGLPAEVILMLVQYCVSINRANMNTIEKFGVEWSNSGINTLEAAENKIKQVKISTANWKTVSGAFGLVNVGSPTAKQLRYADKWVGEWHFSTDMLRAAYEVNIDNTGKLSMPYIDKVLSRWFNAGIFKIEDINLLDQKKSSTKKKTKASYDIDELEKIQ